MSLACVNIGNCFPCSRNTHENPTRSSTCRVLTAALFAISCALVIIGSLDLACSPQFVGLGAVEAAVFVGVGGVLLLMIASLQTQCANNQRNFVYGHPLNTGYASTRFHQKPVPVYTHHKHPPAHPQGNPSTYTYGYNPHHPTGHPPVPAHGHLAPHPHGYPSTHPHNPSRFVEDA